MSALREAARRVVSAWVSTRPAWIEQCNEAVLALDAALKAQPEPAGCETEADCDSQPWCRISEECHRKQKPPEPAQEIDVYSYAALLATAIHAKHYKDTAPRWKPLPDLLGVLTQIDNMTAGLTRQPEPAQEPAAWATEIIDALQAQYDTEMIKENDSGDALIRLDDAIAAVEDAEKHYTTPPKPEPAQEPAAWMHPDGRVVPAATMNAARSDGGASLSSVRDYTIPLLPQRPPLTDEEIEACRQQGYAHAGLGAPFDFGKAARAIERKVRGE